MADADKSLEALSKTLGQSAPMDHARTIVLAALNAVPIVGGSFATLVNAYIPERKHKRLLEFIEKVAQNVDELKDRVSNEYVATDEFAFLFERTFQGALDNYQKEKLDAFRAALLNALVAPADLNAETRELYIRLVNDLTPRHIRILRALIDPPGFDQAHGMRVGSGGGMSTSLISVLRKLFPEYAEAEIDYIVADLDSLALTRMHTALRTIMTDTGIHQLEGRLTKFGQDFVLFITLPEGTT
ncbi:MAG: hypothetical protein KKA54_15225 [Proteobacteria bacterium]|nr:hypothetical protein [Pseudomonadota bacterium]